MFALEHYIPHNLPARILVEHQWRGMYNQAAPLDTKEPNNFTLRPRVFCDVHCVDETSGTV